MPRLLKRALVPIWNGGHRLGWWIGERSDALVRGRIERCSCCGRVAPMLLRRRSIPPRLVALWGLSPREAEALVRKETLLCALCGAKLRARRLASVMMRVFPPEGPPPRSLREWADRPSSQGLRVAEINRIEGLHEAIASLPHLSFSDYAEPGQEGNDAPPSEDLTHLSYPSAFFDLVLTSETLEHVPDLPAALAEILRVLRPGGWHLFTVPVRPGVLRTLSRTTIGPNGAPIHHAPPIAHPGGDWGYPVFTEFGADLPQLLSNAGFETTVHFGPTTEDDLAQVFACRKR